jgi:hypothetical protein
MEGKKRELYSELSFFQKEQKKHSPVAITDAVYGS